MLRPAPQRAVRPGVRPFFVDAVGVLTAPTDFQLRLNDRYAAAAADILSRFAVDGAAAAQASALESGSGAATPALPMPLATPPPPLPLSRPTSV